MRSWRVEEPPQDSVERPGQDWEREEEGRRVRRFWFGEGKAGG